MLICQLRQSAPIPSPARSTQGPLATQRPVFPVRGGTPKPPMPTTQITCLKTKTTAGTLTGVQDRFTMDPDIRWELCDVPKCGKKFIT